MSSCNPPDNPCSSVGTRGSSNAPPTTVGVHNHVRSKLTSPNQSGRMPRDTRGEPSPVGNTTAKGGRALDGDGRVDLPRAGAGPPSPLRAFGEAGEDEPMTPAAG